MELVPCDLFSCGTAWIGAIIEEIAEAGLPVTDYAWVTSSQEAEPTLRVTVAGEDRILHFKLTDIESVLYCYDVRVRLTLYIMNKLSGDGFSITPLELREDGLP